MASRVNVDSSLRATLPTSECPFSSVSNGEDMVSLAEKVSLQRVLVLFRSVLSESTTFSKYLEEVRLIFKHHILLLVQRELVTCDSSSI